MVRTAAAFLLAVALAAPAPAGAATTGDRLQAVLEKVVAEHRLVPGAALHVDAPRAGLPWAGTAGEFAEGSGRPLSLQDPFRIASVQKTFTAAAILRLVEQNRLSLDQPVAPFLEAGQVDRMHEHDGIDYGSRITVRQLLRHTSGLNSHDADDCHEFTVSVATGPRRRWTPEEQIELMIRCGDPKFAPDAPGRWNYSDTGYGMLGKVLAGVTGRDLAGALRELLPLDRLGLDETWHELLEPGRALPQPRAHQYFGPADLTGWDPSFDSWGGGGYVSTVGDLSRFVRGLFEGRVFERRSTLRLMQEAVPLPPDATGPRGAKRYGSGLYFIDYDGIECAGHAGFWSVLMLFCPELDLAFATTTNQASDEHGEHTEGYVAEGVIRAVKEAAALPLRLRVSPRAVRAGRRQRVAVRLMAGDRPVSGARVRLGNRRAWTDVSGAALMRTSFRRPGAQTVEACKRGAGCASAPLRVVR